MVKKPVVQKKHLSFNALRETLSSTIRDIKDERHADKCQYSLHDAFLSGFACMFFQDPTLSEFQQRMEIQCQRNNLQTLFHVNSIPQNTQLRELIDRVDSEYLRPVFKAYFDQLRRAKYLEDYQIIPGYTLCGIDGVYHHSSSAVHCDKCLTKKHRNGKTTYSHGVLQGALLHPDKKQVIPLMPEAIANTDGSDKQDCEVNAAKRFLVKLKADHPRMGLIITGDGLFSKSPMIEQVLAQNFSYLFVAKPGDHTFMMEKINTFGTLPVHQSAGLKGTQHLIRYVNQVPLNGSDHAPLVNYIHYQQMNGEGHVTFQNSWVTNIEINEKNAYALARGGRSRWKIENECFNTLKNQGYQLSHNFGHGKQYLSHNLYLLTLLAFFCHQIFELSDPLYQQCRKKLVTKRFMWEVLRSAIRFFVFENWPDVMLKAMDEDRGKEFVKKK